MVFKERSQLSRSTRDQDQQMARVHFITSRSLILSLRLLKAEVQFFCQNFKNYIPLEATSSLAITRQAPTLIGRREKVTTELVSDIPQAGCMAVALTAVFS